MFENVTSISSLQFSKLVKDMLMVGPLVEIISSSRDIRFLCKGTFVSQETVVEKCASSGSAPEVGEEEGDESIAGLYKLKYIHTLCKAASLSPVVNIYMKNNYPLILALEVSTFASIKMCLVPLVE